MQRGSEVHLFVYHFRIHRCFSPLFRISINFNLYSFVRSKFIRNEKTNLDRYSG